MSSIRNAKPIPPSDPNTHPPSAVQSLLAEHRLRFEKDERQKDNTQRAENKAKADARTTSTQKDPDSAKAIQAKHAAEVKRTLAEDKKHREQILAQIERDKIARIDKNVAEKEMRQIQERQARHAETSRGASSYGNGARATRRRVDDRRVADGVVRPLAREGDLGRFDEEGGYWSGRLGERRLGGT